MLRLLVRQGALASLLEARDAGPRTGVFERLRLPRLSAKSDEPDQSEVHIRLAATLDRMEKNAGKFRLNRRLVNNLELLGRQFALTMAERHILALTVLMRADEDLHTVARSARQQVNVTGQLQAITKLPPHIIRAALAPLGKLRRSGLLDVRGGEHPAYNLQLPRLSLQLLATARLTSIDDLFRSFLRPCPPATLSRSDYPHLAAGFDLVAGLIREALASRREGVNILLHGPPGTGKTALTRSIAGFLGAPLFDVSSIDENGDPLAPRTRLSGAATAQRLLAGRQAVLVFDEIDAIFNDGSRFFGKPTTAETAKAWVNTLLEMNPIPMLWVGNDIERMDPAFLRRFDLVVELNTPPLSQRVHLLEQACGSMVDENDIRRLAHSEAITPAILTRAASVARRVTIPGITTGALMETVVDGTLRAQGHLSVRQASRGLPPGNYDPSLCNASENLTQLALGLSQAHAGRICLYGPPGTGKTAFGHWLAHELDKPLVLKRTSDLQSPFVGVMERNLARAFEQAARDNAILQIDEIDSFLRDRVTARQAWEVSQVNEFLTQLESFDGIFIASTNLMDGLDPAALRRFDYKIRIDYMRPDQIRKMLGDQLDAWGIAVNADQTIDRLLGHLDRLTPGDFAVVRRRHRLLPFMTATAVVDALRAEVELKGGNERRIGFV